MTREEVDHIDPKMHQNPVDILSAHVHLDIVNTPRPSPMEQTR